MNSHSCKIWLTCCVAVLFAICTNQSTAPAQEILLGNPPSVAQRISIDKIDHAPWTALLQKYVDTDGKVNYGDWKKSAVDVAALDAYINSLSTASNKIASTKSGQLAFWINSYNALTVKGILREYPTTTIRNHTSKWGGYNIWKHLKLRFNETAVSLDMIEHEVLRKMKEPRIHFALVCAAQSCPRLLNYAYTGPLLGNQLDANARHFFKDSKNFQFAAPNQFKLNPILKWYATDFGKTQAEQLRAIAAYLPTEESQVAATSSARVSYLKYDWNLNERRTPILPMDSSSTKPASQNLSRDRN